MELRVYVDETGIDQYLYRDRARSIRGKKVFGKISGKKYKRTNIVAAKRGDEILDTGTTDHKFFEQWIVVMLIPLLAIGSVVIMDNASFHRKKVLKTLLEDAGMKIIFLPPYSPDLNCIEKFWAWLKRHLIKVIYDFLNLSDAISACFQT